MNCGSVDITINFATDRYPGTNFKRSQITISFICIALSLDHLMPKLLGPLAQSLTENSGNLGKPVFMQLSFFATLYFVPIWGNVLQLNLF